MKYKLFISALLIYRDIGLSKKDEHRPARRAPAGPPPPMDDPRERQMNDPCKFFIYTTHL
jgi:hypothetical protein